MSRRMVCLCIPLGTAVGLLLLAHLWVVERVLASELTRWTKRFHSVNGFGFVVGLPQTKNPEGARVCTFWVCLNLCR